MESVLVHIVERCHVDRLNCVAHQVPSVVSTVQGFVVHEGFAISQMLAFVHGQAAGTAAESVTFRAEFPPITLLTEDISAVVSDIG